MAKAFGIDVSARAIRVVQMERGGETVRLLSAVTVPTRVFDEALEPGPALDRAIHELRGRLATLAGAGVSLGRGAVGLSGRDLMMRFTRIAPGPAHRVQMLIDFEIDEMREQGGGDLAHGYHALNVESGGGELTLLVALARSAALNARHTRACDAGLAPTRVVPASLGLYNTFTLSGPTLEPGEVALVAHVGDDSTEVCIVRDFDLLFARNINVGGRALAEVLVNHKAATDKTATRTLLRKVNITPSFADDAVTDVTRDLWQAAEEITRAIDSSVNFCRMQLKLPRLDVKRVFLTGEYARLRGFREFCMNRLRRTVTLFDPTDGLDLEALAPAAKSGDGNPETNPHQYAVAIGLARIGLEKDPTTIDLEPDSVTRKRRTLHETVPLYLGALLAVLLLAAVPWRTAVRASDAEKLSADAERLAREYRRGQTAHDRIAPQVSRLRPVAESLRALALPSTQFLGIVRTLRRIAKREVIVKELELMPPDDPSDFSSVRKLRIQLYLEKLGNRAPTDVIAQLERALRRAHPEIKVTPNELPLEPDAALDGGRKFELVITLRRPIAQVREGSR